MSSRGDSRRPGLPGVALLEVLAALAIGALAAGLTASAARLATRAASLAQDLERATALATERLEEVRARGASRSGADVVESGGAAFTRRWKTNATEHGLAIEVEVTWRRAGNHRVRLATLAPLP